jgi:hypothetical protein
MEVCAVRRIVLVGLFAVLCAPVTPAAAQVLPGAARAAPPDVSSQSARRARPRIVVRPENVVRDCRAWLAPERRPSGTVIVQRMRCWWTVAR